jgi:hypothetical protein
MKSRQGLGWISAVNHLPNMLEPRVPFLGWKNGRKEGREGGRKKMKTAKFYCLMIPQFLFHFFYICFYHKTMFRICVPVYFSWAADWLQSLMHARQVFCTQYIYPFLEYTFSWVPIMRPHLIQYLIVVVHTCYPSNGKKHKIGSSWSRSAWLWRETPLKTNQSKKGWRHSSSSRVPHKWEVLSLTLVPQNNKNNKKVLLNYTQHLVDQQFMVHRFLLDMW